MPYKHRVTGSIPVPPTKKPGHLHKMKIIYRNLFFIIIIFLCSICFLETTSYFFFRTKILHVSGGLFMNPHLKYKGITINSYNLRGKKISKIKEKKRIICLGGSQTFGWGVNDEETYPYLLEQKFKKQNKNIEVINAGIPGHSSYQGRIIIEKIIKKIKPDYVTIMFGWNDNVLYGILPDKLKLWNNFYGFILNSLEYSFFYRSYKGFLRSKLLKYKTKQIENKQTPTRIEPQINIYDNKTRVSPQDYIVLCLL